MGLFIKAWCVETSSKPAPAEPGSAVDAEGTIPDRSGVSRGRNANGRRSNFSLRRIYSWHIQPVLWRMMNPGATPEDYYATKIAARLRRGDRHPAIGAKSRPVREHTELLDILQTYGLQPAHVVVDYGCGSFRLGTPLIEYLDPGHYWGLDLVDDFLQTGLDLLGPALLAQKTPQARVISPESLREVRAARPDFIVSWHVCSKVPPSRQADYFGKIIGLMGANSVALVHFPEAVRRTRQSRFSWAESRNAIAAAIHRIDPTLVLRFAPVTEKISHGIRQTMVEIRRRAQ